MQDSSTPSSSPLFIRSPSTVNKNSDQQSPDPLPLSPSSISALAVANGLRHAQGSSKIHMEHLLLGLYYSPPQGPTRRAFEASGLEEKHLLEALNQTLDLVLPPAQSLDLEGTLPLFSEHTFAALEQAELLAIGEEDDQIRTRHLLGGLWQIERCKVVKVVRRLAPDLGAYIPGKVSESEEVPEQVEDARLQPLVNDVPQGPDLLAIESEVHALAEAIALKDMPPPLVVGILGGWGSGKSFVLHLLEEHLGRIRCENLAPGASGGNRETEEFPYVGHPYVIRFDAWTYAKADLWASLMQKIFMDLHRQIGLEQLLFKECKIDPLKGTEIWRLLSRLSDSALREISASPLVSEVVRALPERTLAEALPRLERDALEAEDLWHTFEGLKAEERKALDTTEGELTAARQALETSRHQLDTQVEEVLAKEDRRTAFQPFSEELLAVVSSSVREAWEKQPPEAHEVAKEISAWRRLFKGWGWGSSAIAFFALLALLGPVLVRLFSDFGQQIEGWIGELRAGGLLATLMAGMKAFRSFREWLEERKQAYLQRLEKAQQRRTTKGNPRRAEKLREFQAMGATQLVSLEDEVRKLEAKVEGHRKNVGLTAQHPSLLDFVQGRLQSGIYEERLGLLHQAQKDLLELTAAFLPHASDSPENTAIRKKLFPRDDPRVILMIDDLDRCPPDRVVEVLEAAQLLVKTRLFVVVLAMDVRYITRALEKVYSGVLTRDGEPSGLDYIEKIVQIPYRVRPIRKEALGTFLRAQMKIAEVSTEEPSDAEHPEDVLQAEAETTRYYHDHFSLGGDSEEPPEPPSPQLSSRSIPFPEEGSLGLQSPDQSSSLETAQEPSSPTEAPPWLRGNLPKRVQEFHHSELELLEEAIGAVNISPRAARRLVNVSKLLKIIWFRRGLGEGPRPAVKQAMFGLLATAANYPEVLGELLVDLDQAYSNGQDSQDLLTFLLQRCEAACCSHPQDLCGAIQEALARTLPENLALDDLEYDNFTLVNSFSFVGESEAMSPSSRDAPVHRV